jgi:hypothetical protein
MPELVVIFVVIFVIYGAGWVWQTLNDVVRDINRNNWDNRVYGQVASARAVRRTLGGHDLGRLREVYRRFGELYEGQLHDRQLFESPKVSFVHHSSRALLSIYESSDPSPQLYTQLTFTIPSGWPHRLEIFPQRFQESDVKYLNVDDIRIEDNAFDPRFVVKSNDERFVREFLDAPTRKTIEDLRALLGNDRILISVNSSRLMVRKHSVLGTLEDLTAFAEQSTRLIDRIALFYQKASGIEILDDDPASPPEGDPVCQVCGGAVPKDGRVYCRRCKTPHHKDCWEFNGQCSTYACGEKRSTTSY